MKKISKKLKIIFCVTMFIIAIILALLIFVINKSNTILFQASYINNAWSYTDYGYIIYANGIIEEYDHSSEKRIENPRKAKLTKEELNELKQLAAKVEDKYEKDTSGLRIFDVGVIKKSIYSNKLSKMIVLSRSGDTTGKNSTETSEKILNLTSQLYTKYLNSSTMF